MKGATLMDNELKLGWKFKNLNPEQKATIKAQIAYLQTLLKEDYQSSCCILRCYSSNFTKLAQSRKNF
jgi:hypothetical protein